MMDRVYTYAYSNARVRTLKTELLSEEKILSMIHVKDVQEMIAVLEETQYKDYLVELSVLYQGADLVEMALARSLEDTAVKVLALSPGPAKKTIQALLEKWDIHNLRTVLNAKKYGKSFEDIERYLVVAGSFTRDDIKRLMEQRDVEQVVHALAGTKYEPILTPHLDEYKKTGNVMPLINALYKAYYDGLIHNVLMRFGDEVITKECLKAEIDARNVMNLLRLKHEGVEESEIPKFMIDGGNLTEKELLDLARSKDVEELVGKLKPYYDLTPGLEEYKKRKTLIPLESILERVVLERNIEKLSMGSLSLSLIVLYLYLKENEVSNIRRIARAKEFGVPPEKIEEYVLGMGKHSILGKKIER